MIWATSPGRNRHCSKRVKTSLVHSSIADGQSRPPSLLATRTGEASIPRADFLRHQKRVYAWLHIALISNSSFSDQGTKPALHRTKLRATQKLTTRGLSQRYTETILILKAYSFMEGVSLYCENRIRQQRINTPVHLLTFMNFFCMKIA